MIHSVNYALFKIGRKIMTYKSLRVNPSYRVKHILVFLLIIKSEEKHQKYIERGAKARKCIRSLYFFFTVGRIKCCFTLISKYLISYYFKSLRVNHKAKFGTSKTQYN